MGKKHLKRSLKINLWIMIASILVIVFNNCGETFMISNQASQKPIDDDLNRTCEEKQLLQFEKTYYSFLRRNCVGCHISGGIGNGNFADEDPTTAFKAFASRGYEKISAQALNDNHKPPFTGSQNAPEIEIIKPTWIRAESDFIQCLIDDGRPPKVSEAAKLVSKAIPQPLAKTFVTMTWNLETESSLKAPLIFTVEIRQAEVGGSVRGYEFRNPTLKLKESSLAHYRVRALALYFNEQLHRDVSTYINLD